MGDRSQIDMGRKEGSYYAPFAGGLGPRLTQCGLGPRSTSVPNGVFIHPAVLPQCTWAQNCVGCAPLAEGELGPHLTQRRLS